MAPNVEWYAKRAGEVLAYLAEHYPESAGSPELHPHQDAAYEAAVVGDEGAYLEALRAYMRAGGVRTALEAGDGARTDDALADLQDVLEGALEDARADLGIEEGGTA